MVLPSALTGLAGTQLDSTANVQTTPNVNPDIIAKIAFDPELPRPLRIRRDRAHLQNLEHHHGQAASGQYSTKVGGGGSVNVNVELVKNFRLVSNNYWSDGGGRYMFGNAPDVIVRADGSVEPHALRRLRRGL